MNACRKIDLDFFDRAPSRSVATVRVKASPERVFEVFEDAESWPQWAPPIRKVEWTSPKPFGVGTTRTVTMVGGIVGEEEFCAWDPGRRMAFYFTRTNLPNVVAFGEDYQVRDLEQGACEVTWTMAMEVSGLNRFLLPVTSPLMQFGLRLMLGRFGRYVEAT